MKSYTFTALSLLWLTSFALTVAAKTVPLPRWQAGVEGGIPSYPVRVNLSSEALLADADQAIQSAIDAVETPGVVLLPAGEFKITRPILLRSDVVLRGSGTLDTKLNFEIPPFEEGEGIRPALGFVRFAGVQTEAPVAINQAIRKGEKSLSLAEAAAFTPGDMILIDSENV